MIVIIGITAFLVVAWLMARRRRRTSSARAGAAPAVPTFRVVALGLQGSGKTLLLTSMYRRLYTPGNRGYYIKAPDDQLLELGRWYRQVADSGQDWPSGTTRQEIREFEFSVMAHIGDTATPVVRIGYLEYPGELLTDPDRAGSTDQADLRTAIGAADALIGIIDGLRILQTYRNDSRGAVILQTNLDAMINSMLEARTPIAFVITKWDLLDELHPDEDTRLGIVRNLLMGVDGFRDLVAVHSRRRVIRLIPVTAVGHDFAVLDAGTVRKKPNGTFAPRNVDVPLSAVVPDVLQQVELLLDRETRAAILAEAQRRVRMGPAEALYSLASFTAASAGQALLSVLGGGWLAGTGLSLLLDSFTEQGADNERLAALSEADRWADELVQTRRRVIHHLREQVSMLEARLPASRLGSES
jgi:GTPase SAR1 family protein